MNPWEQHKARWCDCTACDLHQGRSRVVLARGSLPCDMLFIGQAPGTSENLTGDAFDGPAGHEMDHLVDQAFLRVGYRLPVAYTNLVACMPRDENWEETVPPAWGIKACRGRLKEFVAIAQPKLVVLVGGIAAKAISSQKDLALAKDGRMDWLKGRQLIFEQIVHPSNILRSTTIEKGMKRRQCINRIVAALNRLRAPVVQAPKTADRQVSI